MSSTHVGGPRKLSAYDAAMHRLNMALAKYRLTKRWPFVQREPDIDPLDFIPVQDGIREEI